MASSAQIVSLINQIRGTTSTLQRVKLVALAWRSLRGLSREDQLAVAKEIGLEGAEKLVEKLSDRSGISPADLLGAIRKAEGKGISAISKINEVLEELVPEGEPANTTGKTPPPLAAAPPFAPPGEEPFGEAEPSAYEQLPPFPDTLAPPLSAASPLTATQTSARTAATPPAPQPIRPAAATGRAPEQRRTPGKPEKRVAEARAAAPREPHRPPEKAAGTAPGQPEVRGRPDDTALLADLAETGALLRRLRLLSRRIGEADSLDLDQLQRLLELFPGGWSRRRAFEELVRSGVPARIDDTLELVARTLLSSPERLWALTTLQRERQVGAEARDQLLAAAEEPMIRRRLERRLARMALRRRAG